MRRRALAALATTSLLGIGPGGSPARAQDYLGCSAGHALLGGVGISGGIEDPRPPDVHPGQDPNRQTCTFYSLGSAVGWACWLGPLGWCQIGGQTHDGEPVLAECKYGPKECHGVLAVQPLMEIHVYVFNGHAAAWNCGYFLGQDNGCEYVPPPRP